VPITPRKPARGRPIQRAAIDQLAGRSTAPAVTPTRGRVTQETRTVGGGPPRRRPRKPKGRYTGPLYDPTQQLSGPDLHNAASSLTELEFGPQRAAINRALGLATTQGTALADRAQGYYQQLDQAQAPIAGQEAAIGQALNTSLGTNASTGNAAIAASLKAAQDRAAADEQVRGQIGGSQTAGASSEAQAAGDVIAQNTNTAQNQATASSADWQHLADLSRTATAAAGGEAHNQLLNRLANQQAGYRGQLTDLGAKQGAANSKNLTDLRQQAFENLITQGGLNIKSAQLRADTALGQARITEDRRQSQADRRVRLRIARDARLATQAANDAKAARQGERRSTSTGSRTHSGSACQRSSDSTRSAITRRREHREGQGREGREPAERALGRHRQPGRERPQRRDDRPEAQEPVRGEAPAALRQARAAAAARDGRAAAPRLRVRDRGDAGGARALRRDAAAGVAADRRARIRRPALGHVAAERRHVRPVAATQA
jgi:hypothetical protein